jgi:hypothetical protein
MYRDPIGLATITLDRGGPAVAAGMCCRFPALLQASRDDGERNPFFAVQGMGLDAELFFDHHIEGTSKFKYQFFRSHIKGTSTFEYPFLTRVPRDTHPDQGISESQIDYQQVLVLHLGHLQGRPKPRNQVFYRRNVGLLLCPTSRVRDGAWGVSPSSAWVSASGPTGCQATCLSR